MRDFTNLTPAEQKEIVLGLAWIIAGEALAVLLIIGGYI